MASNGKQRKPLSELQKANLLEGQLIFRCSCTSELIAYLKETGNTVAALEVHRAYILARQCARNQAKTAINNAKLKKLMESSDV